MFAWLLGRRQKPTATKPDDAASVTASGPRSTAAGRDVRDNVFVEKVVIEARQEVVPRAFTIPSPVADFTGREKEIEQLTRALTSGSGRAAISAIGGMGGVGKSQLAFEVARLLGDRHFPDGRIHIDMQGTSALALSPADAMGRVIEAFEPGFKPPEDVGRLANQYRGALAGKRVLLLFDNAKDTAQVKDLAPPAPAAMVITSRRAILLDGGMNVDLDTLTDPEALALLRDIVGLGRGTDEELAEIVAACGRLPLAVRAAGSFLRMRKGWKVGDYLARVRDERRRLDALDVDAAEIDVRATLGLSAEQLKVHDPELHEEWTLLAVFPAGFDAAAAAAVWEADEGTARDRLDRLAEWSLVQTEDRTRVRLHDLVRLAAEERAEPDALEAARTRHAAHYVQVLSEANSL